MLLLLTIEFVKLLEIGRSLITIVTVLTGIYESANEITIVTILTGMYESANEIWTLDHHMKVSITV